MHPTPDGARRRANIRSAAVTGGILGAAFLALVGAALVKGCGGGGGRPAGPSAPLLRADQLGSYGGEVVSVRARIKRVTDEPRDGKIEARAAAGFEDNRTGILFFPDMEPAEFARWRASFSEGDWVIVTGTYEPVGEGDGRGHWLTNCTIKPER